MWTAQPQTHVYTHACTYVRAPPYANGTPVQPNPTHAYSTYTCLPPIRFPTCPAPHTSTAYPPPALHPTRPPHRSDPLIPAAVWHPRTDAPVHTRAHECPRTRTHTHEYTRVRTRVVSVKAVATAGSVAEHGEEGLPRRGNTIHTLTHLLRLASVALIAPRQRGDQKSAGGGGCFPFQKFKNGGWSSIQTSRAANHCMPSP